MKVVDYYARVASSSVQLLRGTDMIAEHTRLSQGLMKHAPQKVDLTEFITELFQTAAELMYIGSVDLCFITPTACRRPDCSAVPNGILVVKN